MSVNYKLFQLSRVIGTLLMPKLNKVSNMKSDFQDFFSLPQYLITIKVNILFT